jgi:UDP-N-acetyl-D-mannosaminuronate dehydrogenase
MKSIQLRPERVVERAAEVMAAAGQPLAGARVIVIGVSYKAGVRDLRESPAVPIIEGLIREGAEVSYYDPLIPDLDLPGGRQLHSVAAPEGPGWDLVLVHTVHPGLDYSWAYDCPLVLDATYQFYGAAHRAVV